MAPKPELTIETSFVASYIPYHILLLHRAVVSFFISMFSFLWGQHIWPLASLLFNIFLLYNLGWEKSHQKWCGSSALI